MFEQTKSRFSKLMDGLLDRFIGDGPVEPKALQELETQLHQGVARDCLDPLVGALIQELHDDEEIQVRAAVLELKRPHLRLQNSNQRVTITLLGGSQVVVFTPYCLRRPPRGRGRPRKRKGRKKTSGQGLYPVLAVLGLQFRMSPALVSEVARLVSWGPSIRRETLWSVVGFVSIVRSSHESLGVSPTVA